MSGLKKIAFLTAKPGLSAAEFRRYWREVHGPVVAGSPGYEKWRLRYAQNHVVADGPIGDCFAFSGMAEFLLPGQSSNEDAFSSTAIYQDRIRADELNFIDMRSTVSMAAEEKVIKPGVGPVKLVVISRRSSDLSEITYRARYEEYAEEVLAGVETAIAGWTVNYVLAGTFRRPGAGSVDALAIDSVEELWFGGVEDMLRVAGKATNETLFAARSSFQAEEIVFFDVSARKPN